MNENIVTYNQERNIITKTINGIEKSESSYEIYVDNKSVSDFAYYQLDQEIVKKFGWTYCSATALATCLGLYYNDNTIKPLTFEDSFIVGAGLQTWGHLNEDEKVKKSIFANTEECVNGIKDKLKASQPVIVWVRKEGEPNGSHFVTVIGIKEGVDFENATFEDLVYIDPGYNGKNQLTSFGDSEIKYILHNDNGNFSFRTPYIIDSTGNFVLDDDGNRITDYRQIFGDDFVPQGFIADVDAFKEAGAIVNGEPKEEENTVYGGKGSFEAIYSAIAKTVNKLFMTSVGGVLNGKDENDYLGGSAGNEFNIIML